jgi:hypothetical protein
LSACIAGFLEAPTTFGTEVIPAGSGGVEVVEAGEVVEAEGLGALVHETTSAAHANASGTKTSATVRLRLGRPFQDAIAVGLLARITDSCSAEFAAPPPLTTNPSNCAASDRYQDLAAHRHSMTCWSDGSPHAVT